MDILDRTIAEIQEAYSDESDPLVFEDLLVREKRGKKRKVLKRWLRGMVKSLEQPHSLREWSEQAPSTPSDDPVFKMFDKPSKDKITGIPIIG